MSKDLLREATRALRDVDDVSELEARATRARVMSGLHQSRVRRRTRYAFLLPIAATFVAASAWGAASGKAQLVWQSIEQLVTKATPLRKPPSATKSAGGAAKTSTPSPIATRAGGGAAPAPDTAPSTGVPSPALPDTVTHSALSSLPSGVSNAAPRTSVKSVVADAHSPSPQTPEERADPTLALYRVAHTAHFVDHDPARALTAWDAYLAAAPNGTFAPEARYNRALSLVRLGRNAEAKAALTPFATGVYGSYRQSEASALLQQLDD